MQLFFQMNMQGKPMSMITNLASQLSIVDLSKTTLTNFVSQTEVISSIG
jgi:hypothetical protein